MKKITALLLAVFMAAAIILALSLLASADSKDNALLLGGERGQGFSLSGAALTPGEKYSFPVFISAGGGVMPLTDELMKSSGFKIATSGGGRGVKQISFTKHDGFSYVDIDTDFPEGTEEKYTLTLTDRASGSDMLSIDVEFEIGALADDDTALAQETQPHEGAALTDGAGNPLTGAIL